MTEIDQARSRAAQDPSVRRVAEECIRLGLEWHELTKPDPIIFEKYVRENLKIAYIDPVVHLAMDRLRIRHDQA